MITLDLFETICRSYEFSYSDARSYAMHTARHDIGIYLTASGSAYILVNECRGSLVYSKAMIDNASALRLCIRQVLETFVGIGTGIASDNDKNEVKL